MIRFKPVFRLSLWLGFLGLLSTNCFINANFWNKPKPCVDYLVAVGVLTPSENGRKYNIWSRMDIFESWSASNQKTFGISPRKLTCNKCLLASNPYWACNTEFNMYRNLEWCHASVTQGQNGITFNMYRNLEWRHASVTQGQNAMKLKNFENNFEQLFETSTVSEIYE